MTMKHATDSFSGKGRDSMVKTNHFILLKESTGQEIMVAEAGRYMAARGGLGQGFYHGREGGREGKRSEKQKGRNAAL